jgi:glycosyltransferase involved in cell wall biosynthesis
MSDPSVSVALCTYQGERHLQEQLDSIAVQSRLPNEVVVCDDSSTDGTLGILDRFRSRAPFPVRIHVNDKRLGPAKNFEGAIERCEGELIFLSDQDDVWHPDRLSILVPILVARPQVGAVFCDAEVVDESLLPLGYSLWEFLRFRGQLQRKFLRGEPLDILLKHNVMLGMTLGFKARFRELILPIEAECPHDVWIPLLIAAVADVTMVPRRLSKYRQHEGQVVGAVKRRLQEMAAVKRERTADDFLHTANQYAAARERLAASIAFPARSPRVPRQLQRKIGHLRTRAEMRSGNGRLRLITREALALNYRRFSYGWRSFAVDVLFS